MTRKIKSYGSLSIGRLMLACEEEFSHVLVPQDVVFVESEPAEFHVGLVGVDLRKSHECDSH